MHTCCESKYYLFVSKRSFLLLQLSVGYNAIYEKLDTLSSANQTQVYMHK